MHEMIKRPNLLLILADQMRADALGEATPNIRALADRGARFENCYTPSPLCQPARNSIVTGKYPTHHGVCGNRSQPISMAERQDTYVQHLKEQGYHTALIGTHHYFDRYNVGMDVTEDDEGIKGYGYDHVWQAKHVMEGLHNEGRFIKYLREKGKLEEYREGLKKDGAAYVASLESSETVDGYIGGKGLEYIRHYQDDAPLCLYVGFVGPHGPYWVPGEYDLYDPKDMPAPIGVADPGEIERAKRSRAKYMGMVTLIDYYIGEMLAVLEKKGLLDNTLVILSADHGDLLGDHGLYNKRYYYESSVKVPLVMAGPGITIDERQGTLTVRKALVSTVDLYPTLLDAAGCENIHGNSQREGISLLGLLNGSVMHRKQVYGELGTTMMVRDANWKLVYDPEQGGVQYLFNLRRDPDELDNLAGIPEYRSVEADLVEKLLSRLISITHHTHANEEKNLQRVRV